MPQLFTYFFEVSVCLIFFYGLYHFAFKKLVTFQYNRIYFLISYALSFAIPYFAFDVFPVYVEAIGQGQIVARVPSELVEVVMEKQWGLLEILFLSYLTIALIFLFRLLKGMLIIVGQIYYSKKYYNKEYIIVENSINDQTFTFFNFLFQPSLKKIDNEVAAHEMTHIKQWHTLDIIISELVKVVLWFNPIVYLMQKQIKLNHEYICDSFAASLSSPYKYAQYLSKSISNNNNFILASNFAYKLKNRIIMLEKSIQNTNQKWRYYSLIPIIACLMFFFSCDKYVVEKEVPKSNLKMMISDTVTTFNYDTYEEQVQIVNREVDAMEIVDTVVIFNPETYEEQIQIVKTMVPIEQLEGTNEYDVFLSQQSKKTTILKEDKSLDYFGKDTISSLDFNTGEWTEKVVDNTNKCYGIFWGTRYNYVDKMTAKEAQELLTASVQVLKISRDDSCDNVNSVEGVIVIVSEKKDPMLIKIKNDNFKIEPSEMLKLRMIKGTKIYIEKFIVNGTEELEGKVITII